MARPNWSFNFKVYQNKLSVSFIQMTTDLLGQPIHFLKKKKKKKLNFSFVWALTYPEAESTAFFLQVFFNKFTVLSFMAIFLWAIYGFVWELNTWLFQPMVQPEDSFECETGLSEIVCSLFLIFQISREDTLPVGYSKLYILFISIGKGPMKIHRAMWPTLIWFANIKMKLR